jgi:septal ring factor EnvC (AmiA/AmiB activator)
MKGKGFFILIFLFCNFSDYGQNSVESIRKRRENTLKEIEYANKILEETKGRTRQSLQEVSLINEKLKRRKEYIISLEAESALLMDNINEDESQINSIENEIKRMKDLYASMIVRNYKSRARDFYFIFFLASDNLNQFYQRFRFVKIYMNYIKIQREKYEELVKELMNKRNELKRVQIEKEDLAKAGRKEYATIKEESARKTELLNSLKRKQDEMEKEIREKEKIREKLDREITRLIESETRKAGSAKTGMSLTPVEKLISTDFGKNKGKLPWPTQKGIVSGKYGEHEHPDFKSVKIRNDGIYISTEKGESVRSVFKGIVSKVFSIPGENFTVIIRHGNYYTLYHNIIDVTVKQGQHVETREVIGHVFTDPETKETTLYFQLWRETERNDPELWLAP